MMIVGDNPERVGSEVACRTSVSLAMNADTTARQLRAAVTDSDRHITYDAVHRPKVSNPVLFGALASSRDPEKFAADVGDGGASTLKGLVTEAINEHLAPSAPDAPSSRPTPVSCRRHSQPAAPAA